MVTSTMLSPQDQQRVLAEIMRGLGSWGQSRPKADTTVAQVVAQKLNNLMNKPQNTQTHPVQSPGVQRSDTQMNMERFLTAVKKEHKSADDHRLIQEIVGLLHHLSTKAKHITGTDQEKITKFVGRLCQQYQWNADEQNKLIAEPVRYGHVSPVKAMACPDAVISCIPTNPMARTPSGHSMTMDTLHTAKVPILRSRTGLGTFRMRLTSVPHGIFLIAIPLSHGRSWRRCHRSCCIYN